MGSNVDHPEHYNNDRIEAIEGIRAALSDDELRGFIKGNVLKYLWRESHKHGVEDLQKAKWYLDWYIKEVANRV